ncbi:hypothetical protein [Paraburkholderia sp. WP4_3_2]|uniref:hypothetical protein n=1 Tax=Paraburkholderia sp. WP4_3_2 TaxID=2587162 RepID=UPI001607B7E2|nr:hypothetical protein [Paraburkholderia sp. WP4_3_2]MBB3261265.1 hypothetical protein [Paraburkholderia sp. WP4_3_2]
MSCNKHPAAAALIGLVLGSVIGSACAATTPSLAGALTPGAQPSNHAQTGTVDLGHAAAPSRAVGNAASGTTVAAQPAATQSPAAQPSSTQQPSTQQPSTQPQPDAATGHLTLGELDNLARNKLASTLRGTPDVSAASAAAATKPVIQDAAPRAQAPSAPVYVPRAHVDPVAFLGSYTDGLGQHVLYQYNGSVYPALIGEKLLNGWIARRVDGQMVTVSEGRATRHIAMSGDAPVSSVIAQPSPFGGGPSLLGDLSQPLPRGMVGSPIMQTGR